MDELVELLSPCPILRLFLILLAAVVVIYGPMWLSGGLEGFLLRGQSQWLN